MYETSCQSRFNARYWMLGAGALGHPAAAAAKSLQSCPTLCSPIDGSPPGSAVPGILQASHLQRFWSPRKQNLTLLPLLLLTLSFSSFQGAEFYTHSLFMGPFCSSCSPEVRRPSTQSRSRQSSSDHAFWKLWEQGESRRDDRWRRLL